MAVTCSDVRAIKRGLRRPEGLAPSEKGYSRLGVCPRTSYNKAFTTANSNEGGPGEHSVLSRWENPARAIPPKSPRRGC